MRRTNRATEVTRAGFPVRSEDEVALRRVPAALYAAFLSEARRGRVADSLGAWYAGRNISGRFGLCPVGNAGFSQLAAHYLMLNDYVRLDAFSKAIRRTVKPGDTVVDLGTGTGILAFLACSAGARRVYAIDRNEVLVLAEELADKNGMSDRIIFVRGVSESLALPEKADVLISECLGSGGVGTAQVASVLDARRRFLRPRGHMVPEAVDVIAAPVEAVLLDLALRLSVPGTVGLDFSAAELRMRSLVHTVTVDRRLLLADGKRFFRLRYDSDSAYSGFRGSNRLKAERNGTVHGLCLWFRARLARGVVLDTAPGLPATHWYQCYLPLLSPLGVRKDSIMEIELSHGYRHKESVWGWCVTVKDRDGTIQTASPQSSLNSYPRPRKVLANQ